METSCFSLVYRLTVASPCLWITKLPWKGRGYVTWPVLNFGGPLHISGMAEARAVKFSTNVGYIYKISPKEWQMTPKRSMVRNNSPRHSVNCDQQCRRRRATDYRTFDGRRYSASVAAIHLRHNRCLLPGNYTLWAVAYNMVDLALSSVARFIGVSMQIYLFYVQTLCWDT